MGFKINTQRNTAIEGLRFIFMIQICVWHYFGPFGFMKAGFLGVEFYFILAGYFIYYNVSKSQNTLSTIHYSLKKVKKFYIEYVLALLLTYIVSYPLVVRGINNNGVLFEILKFFGQLLFIQNTGPFPNGYNSPVWFFSILVWGGGLVYLLTRDFKRLSLSIFYPLLLILFLSYCFQENGKGLEQWGVVGGAFPIALIRGVAEMGFGVIIGYAYDKYLKKITLATNLINVILIISVLFYCWISLTKSGVQYSFIFIPIILLSAFYPSSITCKLFQNIIWNKLGKLSFSLFLIHVPLGRVIKNFPFFNLGVDSPNAVYGFIIYLILLVPLSYYFMLFAEFIRKKLSNPRFSAIKVER